MFNERKIRLLLLLAALSAPGARLAAQEQAPLQPGDMLRVAIWREEDLTGEFPVDERGTVVLPLIGAQQVAGENMDAMRARLTALFERELQNPSIMLTPLRRVFVLGSVRGPGTYHIDPTTTVTAAIAQAAGISPDGKRDIVRVTQADGTVIELFPHEGPMTYVIRSGDQIYVPERSWFSRNASLLTTSVLTTITSVAVSLIVSKN